MKQGSHYQEILHVVSRIARHTNPQHLPVLRKLQISLAQFLVLDVLGHQDHDLRMSELAAAAGLPPSELTRVVDELAAKGWIERGVDPTDSRARVVGITKKGARLMAQAHAQAAVELRGVWSDFTHDEWHRFTDYLHRFAAALSRVRTQAGLDRRGKAGRWKGETR